MIKKELGLTLIRVVLGLIFFGHGLAKFQGGIGNVADWFQSLGLPGFIAYIVGSIELVGGIALILGIFTRIISALYVLIMAGAILFAKLSSGFIDGYELDLLILVTALYLALSGSRFLSLDSIVFKSKVRY